MNDEFIGTVALFPYDAIPYNYLRCDGSIVSLVRYSNLGSLLKDTFGGDGIQNFGLPDLGIHVPVGAGQGRHGINIDFAESIGTEWNQLTESNLAAHTHPVIGVAHIGATPLDDQSSNSPEASFLRATPGIDTYASEPDAHMGKTTFEITFNNTGGTTRINNMQPTMAMVYAICHDGTMPPCS